MSRLYRIHEFATLAGVTVKALRHYDRLGLLKPSRAASGYRLYASSDLERLEQIVALKFLGVPLKQIRALLDSPGMDLPRALQLQRQALEKERQWITRAIEAIREAERSAAPSILKRIIEVVAMQESVDVMKRYYLDEELWQRQRTFFERWPSEEWKALYRDIEAALGESPAGANGQALAIRWIRLVDSDTSGEPEGRWGWTVAWRDRHYWPPELQRRAAEFKLDRIWEFVGRAFLSLRTKHYTDESWAGQFGISPYSEWGRVFLGIVGSLGDDPTGERVQAIVAQLWELDPTRERLHGLIASWKELARQSDGEDVLLRQIALFHLEQVWDFVGKATYVALTR